VFWGAGTPRYPIPGPPYKSLDPLMESALPTAISAEVAPWTPRGSDRSYRLTARSRAGVSTADQGSADTVVHRAREKSHRGHRSAPGSMRGPGWRELSLGAVGYGEWGIPQRAMGATGQEKAFLARN